jgi:hypothetical protein
MCKIDNLGVILEAFAEVIEDALKSDVTEVKLSAILLKNVFKDLALKVMFGKCDAIDFNYVDKLYETIRDLELYAYKSFEDMVHVEKGCEKNSNCYSGALFSMAVGVTKFIEDKLEVLELEKQHKGEEDE